MNDVRDMQFRLYKLGYLLSVNVDNSYGPLTIAALKKFQTDNGLPATGSTDTKTMAKLKQLTTAHYSDPRNEMVEDDKKAGSPVASTTSVNTYDERYEKSEDNLKGTFFNKSDDFRKTNIPIRIEYGPNRTSKKTITNVYFRSLGQQLDGSGTPIYDVIEFIGRDIEEE